MNTTAKETVKRDRKKVMRSKVMDRDVLSANMVQRKIRMTEEEDAMLQHILANKIVDGKKVSMRDLLAGYITEEYNKLGGGN